jgi:hypothetical protein
MQDGEDEEARWYFTCDAEDAEHAEEQALDGYGAYVIAVYRRVNLLSDSKKGTSNE